MPHHCAMPAPTACLPPIAELRRRLSAAGAHAELIDGVLTAARAPAAEHVFIGAPFDAGARAAARAADALLAAGRAATSLGPLAGLPVTVKDLFDVAGQLTLAGSRLRRDAPRATRDAAAVARLRAAGAAIVGRTNMTEFGYSGVGINPHHGTPRNPCDDDIVRIPGGSSSGAAVSVALGLAVAGLGTDTGGSIRIPAALTGIVGFKNTQRRTPATGAFPLSFTLDTVCSMSRSVADCLLVDGVLAGAPLAVRRREAADLVLALPRTLMLDDLERPVAAAFARALAALGRAGARIVELPFGEFGELAAVTAPAGFSAVEAWATHREAMSTRRAEFDPRVAQRIAPGEGVSAADYIRMHERRRDWIGRVSAHFEGIDALVCPTVPMVAPALAPLVESDELFFEANGLLLRNTWPINLLDGCAFSLPCQAPGELPVGLMLAAPGGRDAELAAVALAVEALLARSA